MELKDDIELSNTRKKLRLLEERYEASNQDADADSHVSELSRRSLKRMINQMKEEIARYEARSVAKE